MSGHGDLRSGHLIGHQWGGLRSGISGGSRAGHAVGNGGSCIRRGGIRRGCRRSRHHVRRSLLIDHRNLNGLL